MQTPGTSSRFVRAYWAIIRRPFWVLGVFILGAIVYQIIYEMYFDIRLPGHNEKSDRNRCQDNMQKIDGAKAYWAMDNHKGPNDVPSWGDLVPRYMKYKPYCPVDKFKDGRTYKINAVDKLPECNQSSNGHRHYFPALESEQRQ